MSETERPRSARPAPPGDLRARGRGRAFWALVVRDYSLRPDELELLREVARMLDLVEELAGTVAADGAMLEREQGPPVANPALVELRHQRMELRRMVAALGLPDEGEELGGDALSVRNRRAAMARWRGRGARAHGA